MPDTEIRELQAHDFISESTIHGFPSFILGIIFSAVGFLGLFLIFSSGSRKLILTGMPPYLLSAIPAFFILAGTKLFFHGLKGLLKEKKKKESQEYFPHEAWRWDYSWDTAGTIDISSNTMYKAFKVSLVFFLFFLPFNWLVFLSDEINIGGMFWKLIVGLFDIVTLAIFVIGVFLLMRRIRYGVGKLRFNAFPFFLGNEVNVFFGGVRGLGNMRSMSATLRFIEERYERRQSGDESTTEITCYQLYADKQTFTKSETSNKGFLSISFALPEGDFETSLSKRPPRYWELEIKADVPGIDYKAAFLLPVYKR